MNKRILFFATALALGTVVYYGCKTTPPASVTMTPEAGTSYKAGEDVKVSVNLSGGKADSIVYLIDSAKYTAKKDTSVLVLKTDSMRLGNKLITARVYTDGKAQEVSTNIILMAAKAPEQYTYKVVKVFPHDTSAYTEGLLYQDGFLYESTGSKGHSSLRKVNLETGKVVQEAKLDPELFGEGISIIGDKILMLTYTQPEPAFVFDKNTFKVLNKFINHVGVEGWGMCFDGNKLYFDDSTNRIWLLDKDTYHETGYIDVYTDKAAVDSVNELEYIDNKLYSNIYQKDSIITINPKTGAVLQMIDMKNLWPLSQHPRDFDEGNNVLNGIAYDPKGKRIFVTGKKWPHLYQVEFVKK